MSGLKIVLMMTNILELFFAMNSFPIIVQEYSMKLVENVIQLFINYLEVYSPVDQTGRRFFDLFD